MMGLHITVDTGAETVPVHLGPVWFFVRQKLQLRSGDDVEIIGSRVTVEGNPAVIAARLTHSDQVVRLRWTDERPVWRHGRGPR